MLLLRLIDQPLVLAPIVDHLLDLPPRLHHEFIPEWELKVYGLERVDVEYLIWLYVSTEDGKIDRSQHFMLELTDVGVTEYDIALMSVHGEWEESNGDGHLLPLLDAYFL